MRLVRRMRVQGMSTLSCAIDGRSRAGTRSAVLGGSSEQRLASRRRRTTDVRRPRRLRTSGRRAVVVVMAVPWHSAWDRRTKKRLQYHSGCVNAIELSRDQRRTHGALVAAARDLVAEGLTPTVEDAAERGRGLPDDRLPLLPQPDRAAGGRAPRGRPTAAARRRSRRPTRRDRLDAVDRRASSTCCSTPRPSSARCCGSRSTRRRSARSTCRCGRAAAIGWIAEALAPLARPGGPSRSSARLALAVRAATGIEALVWLDRRRRPERARRPSS